MSEVDTNELGKNMSKKTNTDTQQKKFVASFSGGKDSVLAIYRAIKLGHKPIALITTYNDDIEKSWFHNIPKSYLENVAKSLNIPLYLILTKGDDYEEKFEKTLSYFKEQGCDFCVFGDIDIKRHFKWCSDRCINVGMDYLFPLWQENRKKLVYEFIDNDFKSVITIVKNSEMSDRFLGQTLSYELVEDIEKEGVDVCGENGEYHSFVYGGPLFSKKINMIFDVVETKDNYSRINFL